MDVNVYYMYMYLYPCIELIPDAHAVRVAHRHHYDIITITMRYNEYLRNHT